MIRKIKRRQREIDYSRVEQLQETLDLNNVEMASLMGVSASQLHKYRKCGRAPADRYYGTIKGYIDHVKQEAQGKIDRVTSLL